MENLLKFVFLTLLGVSIAASLSVVLEPMETNVAVGGMIRLKCTAVGLLNCSYEALLYKVEGNNREATVLPEGLGANHVISYAHNCTPVIDRRKHIFSTSFIVEAGSDSNGTYGCFVQQMGNERPLTTSREAGPHEVTVYLCSEPHLTMKNTSLGGGHHIISAEENCSFRGLLTWLVNGWPVPREANDPSSFAVQKENDSLEIYRTAGCDLNAKESRCNVTAKLRYFSDKHLRVSRQTKEISGCCVDIPSKEAPTEKNPPTQKPHAETPWEEKWQLKKDVLELRKDVLMPLQIEFLQKLLGRNATKTKFRMQEIEAVMLDK